MTTRVDPLWAAIALAAGTGRPVAVALMHLLIEARDETAAREALDAATAQRDAEGDIAGAARLRDLRALWSSHPDAWARVRGTIEGIAHEPAAGTPADSLRYWATAFDRLVAASPETSVALYCLGSADLLAAATAEVVERMDGWGLLGPSVDVLDLGCGIGRIAAALAPRVRSVLGLDLSAGMIAEARRRHATSRNLRFERSDGQGLGPVATGSLDLVLAADVFPYLVGAGASLVEAHFDEMARVLRPGGRVLILNFSYRGDLDRDRRETAEHARRVGLTVVRDATRDLASWDAVTFLLARP